LVSALLFLVSLKAIIKTQNDPNWYFSFSMHWCLEVEMMVGAFSVVSSRFFIFLAFHFLFLNLKLESITSFPQYMMGLENVYQ